MPFHAFKSFEKDSQKNINSLFCQFCTSKDRHVLSDGSFNEKQLIKFCKIKLWIIFVFYRGKPKNQNDFKLHLNHFIKFKPCMFRSSHRPKVFCKKVVFRKLCKFHRKTLAPESLFSKVAGSKLATLLKRDSNTKFAKLFKTTILKDSCE